MGALVKLINHITKVAFVPAQNLKKELKRFHPSGQPKAPMACVIRGSQ